VSLSRIVVARTIVSKSVSGTGLDGTPTIAKVIGFLEKLLDKSQSEGELERNSYEEFKNYCDDNDAKKSSGLKDLTEGISKLENEIDGLFAANGELSTQCAKLKKDLSENANSQTQALAIRSQAEKEFKAEMADLQRAIGQLGEAIEILFKVGADQSRNSGADHAQFMAGFGKKQGSSFLSLGAESRHTLAMVSELLPASQQSSFNSFLQAPFTGSYTANSASIVGILKSMRDTFQTNLESATENENLDASAHATMMTNLVDVEQKMTKAYQDKQDELGENDSKLAEKKLQLKSAKDAKKSAEDFLERLRPMCSKKAIEFEIRAKLRASEETVISQALRALSSEEEAVTGKSKSMFLQLRTKHRSAVVEVHVRIQELLQQASSIRFAKLLDMLEAKSPFASLLQEMNKIVGLIDEEQQAESGEHGFCKRETSTGSKKLKETEDEIEDLQATLSKLEESIEKPLTGLEAQEAALEKSIKENIDSQKKETEMRQKENVQYQKNVADLAKAEELLEKAAKILKKFYASLDEDSGVSSFLQGRLDENPPQTWSGAYSGQSSDVTGQNGVLSMLKLISEHTKEQLAQAHKDEQDAQHDFESSMAELSKEQRDQETNLVKMKNALAQTNEEMVAKKADLKQAMKDKSATEQYLESIKSRCDFILAHFEAHTKDREVEKNALENAQSLLKKSPLYQAGAVEAEAKALGPCKTVCQMDPNDVKCKACVARVSVPGYCVGHPGTPGC